MFDDRETFVALYLNTKNRVIKKEIVSFGSLNANVVHPREVYKEAILNSAASVIVSHNHPSGDPTPSREDLEITEKLYEAGKIIGISLLDHVIIGEDGYFYSLKERGHIK
jgi:DNA repair protein RadC